MGIFKRITDIISANMQEMVSQAENPESMLKQAVRGDMAICLLLIPAALVEVFYIAIFPLTVLVGLVSKPAHWVFWFIRWDRFKMRALWGLLIVPALELWGLFWWAVELELVSFRPSPQPASSEAPRGMP